MRERAPAATTRHGDDEARYILITQCLQNDLFLNHGCRLALPEKVVGDMLVGKGHGRLPVENGRTKLSEKTLANGPLGVFLDATIGRRRRGLGDSNGDLHVVNIRDWHIPNEYYDVERRSYGPHCEKGTWGAAYIDGLERYLDPHGSSVSEEARDFHEGNVHIHHVHSDSIFDFRPRQQQGPRSERGKFVNSELEEILDDLIQGTPGDAPVPPRVYVAVIGPYTDIKVRLLLVGLRTRYNLPNLAVSDTLTASKTLERHLTGLDFADWILNVEVIHGLNDLVSFLGGCYEIPNESELVAGESFARYRTYFMDKQQVLAYQDEKLREYLAFTEQRAITVYERIKRANTFLIVWGSVFLVLTLVASVMELAGVGDFDWKLPAVTGGLGLLQLVTAFFSGPIRDLQRNLTNLAVFKMILESHSLKAAFTRYHLTTPETLRELQDAAEAETAARQIEALRQQLDVIEKTDAVDYAALERLGFRVNDGAGAAAAAANGRAAGTGAPTQEKQAGS